MVQISALEGMYGLMCEERAREEDVLFARRCDRDVAAYDVKQQ